MISPERLANERFGATVLPTLRRGVGLFVVDEAHCISRLGPRLPAATTGASGGSSPRCRPRIPVLATTATANDRVVDDIAEQFGEGVAVIRGPLARDILRAPGDRAARRRRADGLAGRAAARDAGQRHRLLPHGRRLERVAAWLRVAGHRRHGVPRRMLPDGARRPRGGPAREPREGAGGHAPRWGWASTSPTSASSSTSSGRARVIAYYQQVGRAGPRARRRVRRAAQRPRGRRDPRLLHRQRVPARHRHGGGHRRAGRRRPRCRSSSWRPRSTCGARGSRRR